MRGVLRFEVLGPLRVCRDGTELDLGFPQQRALLGLLVVRAGRPVPVGEIVDALWPGRPPASAMNVVRRYAGSLRRLLEPGLPPRAPGHRLPRRAGGYLLEAAEDEVDLLRFRALAKRGKRAAATGRSEVALRHFVDALGEWHGPVAMGIPVAVRHHALFAEVERELIHTTRMATDAALLCGRAELVLPRLRQAVELDPLDESSHAGLVMALAASGLQAEALAAYERVRRLLAEELGVAPGTELAAAHTRVLRQQWGPTDPHTAQEWRPTDARTAREWEPDDAHTAQGWGPTDAHTAPAPASASAPSLTPVHSASSSPSPSPSLVLSPAPAPTPAVVPRPAQLPPDLPMFVGRQAELDRLREITDAAPAATEAPTTVLIVGMPGIGKTTLAVHWAHRIAEQFPDGQLHVDLRGFDPGHAPLDPAEALRRMLTALGVPPSRTPARTDSLAGLYRSLLAGRRLLVVLDDAADTEQVRPLLPASPGCLTLVTSRRGLSGLTAAGAHPLPLDLPPAADARATLASRTGHDRVTAEPEAADEIVTRCGRLPLALAIVAARATDRPDSPLSAIAAELRRSRGTLNAFADTGTDTGTGTGTGKANDDFADTGGAADPSPGTGAATAPSPNTAGTADARTAFAVSYRRLPPENARLFRLLSLHPGPDLGPDTAAALADIPARRARLLLDELADAHLVTEHAPGRYAPHDLLRVFAAELTDTYDSPEDRNTARRRLLDHISRTGRP